MSGMRALVAMAMLGPPIAMLGACSDPTFDIRITYEQLPSVPEDQQLARHVATLTVSVIDAVAAGAAAGLDTGEATCEDVALGRVPEAVLEGARRASVGALDTPRISGVPRLGAKLVVAEARNAAGRRVGAGCNEDFDDIESNSTVPVLVHVAPRVRVFTRDEIGDQPSPVQLVVTAPWNDLLPLPERYVLAELFASSGRVDWTDGTTSELGLLRTKQLTLAEPGPAQTVIRVRWADEPLRVPAFALWPAMPINGAPRFTLVPDDGSRTDRSWVSGPATINGVTSWSAAALEKDAQANAEQVLVVRFNQQTDRLFTTTVPTPGTRAMALWQRELYTITASGWNKIEVGGLQPLAGDAPGVGPATEIHAFEGCGNAPGAGLLVRRAVGMTEQYVAYDAPGDLAETDDPLAVMAAALDPAIDAIVAHACIELEGQDVRVVATRGNSAGLTAWLSTGPPTLALSTVHIATSFERGDGSFIAGVEGTITGPRVTSYRLTNIPIAANTLTGFVAVDGVETELATLPLSLAVDDLDDDDLYDVLAVLPSLAGPRIQANFGRMVAGEQLISVSKAVGGGRTATNPIVRLEDVDGMGHKELVLMTDEGIDVFCFDVRTGAGGMQCASQ